MDEPLLKTVYHWSRKSPPWWMSRYWKLHITEAGNLLQNLVSLMDEPLLKTAYHWSRKSPPKSCIPNGWAATEKCITLKQEISSKTMYPWRMSRYWKLQITEIVNLLQNLSSLMDEPLLKTAYHWSRKSPPKSCIPNGWAATEKCISLKQEISSKIVYPWRMSRYWKLQITETVNLLQNLASLSYELLLTNSTSMKQ